MSSKAKEELSKGQPSLTIMALRSSDCSIQFWGKIDYLSSSIYFTTKFIINFRLLSEFLYQSASERILQQAIGYLNKLILGSSTFPAKFESACGVLRLTTLCQCFEPSFEPAWSGYQENTHKPRFQTTTT